MSEPEDEEDFVSSNRSDSIEGEEEPEPQTIIGRGTWLDRVAAEIIAREKSLGRDLSLIRVESGLGASGIPHIGSLGDAARAYGIKMALEEAEIGRASCTERV